MGVEILFLFYLMNLSKSEYYADADMISVARLIIILISLSFYFLFRQKLLIKINKIWLRSFVSGIIAIILTIPFINLIEYLLF